MKSVEIVSHCYCPPNLDQYAQHLRVQAASLIHWPPASCKVTLLVCHGYHDETTRAAIEEISSWNKPNNVEFWFLALQNQSLFRRAIGRNMRAKLTDADIVYMTDVDYFFGEHCIDDMAEYVMPDDPLSMPSHILIHQDHATGDAELARMRHERIPRPDLSLFVDRKQKLCIGGVQILGGDWARKHGYLDGTRWVEPVSEAEGFRSCKCDKAFRSHSKLSAKRLPIRGCYRCRHTRDGRDYTVDGTKVGRQVW